MRLTGDAARRFLDAARHPDPDAIRRRDEFLAEIARSGSFRREGADIVMDIELRQQNKGEREYVEQDGEEGLNQGF